MDDIPSFERYMAQLRCYYGDYNDSLPMSAYQYELTGLNLLSLLAQNRLAEFHTVGEDFGAESSGCCSCCVVGAGTSSS